MLNTYITSRRKQMLTILFITGILSVSGELLFTRSSYAAVYNTIKPLPTKADQILPPVVAQSVLRDISRRMIIPQHKIRIIAYSQRYWRNSCLDIYRPNEFCTQALVDGWQVIATYNNKKWRYHTNSNGSVLRLATINIFSNKEIINLPTSIRESLLKAAAQHLKLKTSELLIVQISQENWKDSCLGLEDFNQVCTTALVSGWKVVVMGIGKCLIYHIDQTGSVIKLNKSAIGISITNLFNAISNTVITDAQQRLGIDKYQLRITQIQPITTDGCLDLPKLGEFCTQITLKSWQVRVKGNKQLLVYHVHPDQKQVRLNISASRITLPISISNRVLDQASQISSLPKQSLKIVKSQPKQWEFSNVDQLCKPLKVSGWEVVVNTYKERLVFLSDRRGKLIQQVNSLNAISKNTLPSRILEKVLVKTSQDTFLPVNKLQVVEIKRKKPSNSCMETKPENPVCNTEMVAVWQVTISHGKNKWIYRVGEIVKIWLEPQLSPNH